MKIKAFSIKNSGTALGHKFSRVSMRATKNYYRLFQIAHLINQLFELQQRIKEILKGRITLAQLFLELLKKIREKTFTKKTAISLARKNTETIHLIKKERPALKTQGALQITKQVYEYKI